MRLTFLNQVSLFFSELLFSENARVPLAEAKKEAIRLATLALFQFKKNIMPENKESAAKALMTLKANWSRAGKVQGITADVLKELGAPRNRRSKRPLFDLINDREVFDIRLFEEKFIKALSLSSEFDTIGENVKSIGRSFVNSEMEFSSQMEFPFEHFRDTRSAKGLYGDPIYRNSVEILSMWKSKGREFDHVLVLFYPRELSTSVSIETERRLLYVACTRAKEWLGVIYPEGSPGQILAQVLGLR